MEPEKAVVLIEPGFYGPGHSRDKALLMSHGFRGIGYRTTIVTPPVPRGGLSYPEQSGAFPFWSRLFDGCYRAWTSLAQPRWMRDSILRKVILRSAVPLVWAGEFLVHWQGFRLAKRDGALPVSLTSSRPYGVWLAAACCRPRRYALKLHNIGTLRRRGRWRLLRPVFVALARMRPSARLMVSSRRDYRSLRMVFGTGAVAFHPDPVGLLDESRFAAAAGEAPQNLLLVIACDRPGREPLRHLQAIGARPQRWDLHILESGRKFISLIDGSEWTPPPWIGRVVLDSSHHGEKIPELIAKVRATLIAYHPGFLAVSSLMVWSVICGRPVIYSDCPESLRLAARFGRIGESFVYDDPASLAAAFDRLEAWGEEEWQAFRGASARLREECSPEAAARAYCALLGEDRSAEGGQRKNKQT